VAAPRGGPGNSGSVISGSLALLYRRYRVVANQRSEAMKRTRRNHGATFKAQVAVAAVKGDKTLAEIAEHFHVHPTQITEGKQQLLTRASDVFVGTKPTLDTPNLKTLHAKSRTTRTGE
jgi:transposase